MKNQMYPKLLVMAVLSAMFIFASFGKADVLTTSGTVKAGTVETTTVKAQSQKDAKKSTVVVEQDYWIRWKHQFVWSLPGKTSTLLPQNTGC